MCLKIKNKVVVINHNGYLERQYDHRDWWLTKFSTNTSAYIPIKNINIPIKYLGKRVKLKIEIVEV